MKQRLAKLGVAAAIAMTMLSGTAGYAAAQGVDIYVGPGHHGPQVQFGNPPPDYRRPPPGYYDRPRGCDPRDAMDAARDYGLRRPRVVDVTPRRVIVDGFGRRGPDTLVFANVRGCPLLGR
ncbi:MAG: hypothetical protein KGI75_31940 [Rhizobiaceae bacterium]|nr:hypothetical protein [Rhizobiaceae bacterium]